MSKSLDSLVYNVRYWPDVGSRPKRGFYIAETVLDHNTIVIDLDQYEIVKCATYNNKPIYRRRQEKNETR